MSKMDDLRWVRAYTSAFIPKYLIEQIKKRDYEVDKFLQYQEKLCSSKNPLSHLYVLANPDNLVKGFLWLTIDPLTGNILIQTYSVDKEYVKDGKAVEKLKEFILSFKDKGNFNKVYWLTAYPKHSLKHGFKKSKSVLMEYDEKIDNNEDQEQNQIKNIEEEK